MRTNGQRGSTPTAAAGGECKGLRPEWQRRYERLWTWVKEVVYCGTPEVVSVFMREVSGMSGSDLEALAERMLELAKAEMRAARMQMRAVWQIVGLCYHKAKSEQSRQ